MTGDSVRTANFSLAPTTLELDSVTVEVHRPERWRERLTAEREGRSRSAPEFAGLDLSEVAPGRYRLRVTVTDRHLGERVSRVRPVRIVE